MYKSLWINIIFWFPLWRLDDVPPPREYLVNIHVCPISVSHLYQLVGKVTWLKKYLEHGNKL